MSEPQRLPDAPWPDGRQRVRVAYRGRGDPHAAREAVFGAAYEALTGRPAEEFTGPIRSHAFVEGSARDHCGWTDPKAPRTAMSACGQHRDRHAEEFPGPRGWYVAEMVVRDPDGNPEVWARWTTEDPGRTGPAHLLDPNFREKLRRAGWHVSYLSPGAPLEPLTGRPSAPDGGAVSRPPGGRLR